MPVAGECEGLALTALGRKEISALFGLKAWISDERSKNLEQASNMYLYLLIYIEILTDRITAIDDPVLADDVARTVAELEQNDVGNGASLQELTT